MLKTDGAKRKTTPKSPGISHLRQENFFLITKGKVVEKILWTLSYYDSIDNHFNSTKVKEISQQF
jgi:hypothetical protein